MNLFFSILKEKQKNKIFHPLVAPPVLSTTGAGPGWDSHMDSRHLHSWPAAFQGAHYQVAGVELELHCRQSDKEFRCPEGFLNCYSLRLLHEITFELKKYSEFNASFTPVSL